MSELGRQFVNVLALGHSFTQTADARIPMLNVGALDGVGTNGLGTSGFGTNGFANDAFATWPKAAVAFANAAAPVVKVAMSIFPLIMSSSFVKYFKV